MLKKQFLAVFIFVSLINISVKAQDTILIGVQDTLITDINEVVAPYKHSPTRAALLSAIVPGMGQLYNRKYWKVPIVYAGLGTLGFYIIKFNNYYQKYQNAYVRFKKFGDTEGLNDLPNYNPIYENTEYQLKYYKDIYRRWRDMDVLLFGAVYILNIIDATVDAYLFNYDISEDLSLRIEPTMLNTFGSHGTPGLKLSIKIW